MTIKEEIHMSFVQGTNRTHLAAQLTCAYCSLIATGMSMDDADNMVMQVFAGMDGLLKRMEDLGRSHQA